VIELIKKFATGVLFILVVDERFAIYLTYRKIISKIITSKK